MACKEYLRCILQTKGNRGAQRIDAGLMICRAERQVMRRVHLAVRSSRSGADRVMVTRTALREVAVWTLTRTEGTCSGRAGWAGSVAGLGQH